MHENDGLPEVIHTFVEPFQARDNARYDVRVLGRERSDGTWIGWLEFTDPLGAVLRTDRETTQSSGAQIKYWAEGLELTYLEGAFERAMRS